MKKIYFFLLLSCITFRVLSQPTLVFTPVVSTGLVGAVDVVNAADGTNRFFVVQQGGTVRAYDAAWSLLNANFLTISTNISTGGERGLLSLAFHPQFEINRYFFVYYTNSAGGINLDRFQVQAGNPNQADAASRTNIMTINKPVNFSNHNGGKLNFGTDGHLYFGLGDAGSGDDPRNYAQRGDSLWGKMVRINVDNFTTPPFYTVPADNPYVSDPLVLDEIYNMGLRNPWRWSFDRLNGNMWIADVGQGGREEINVRAAGQTSGVNYGWRCYEGVNPYLTSGCQPASNYIFPVFDYPHNSGTGGFSVTGGYVYRGSLYPALYGYYICADYVSGNSWVINSTTFAATRYGGLASNISGFGEAENGELFASSLTNVIYSVSTSTILPLQILRFDGYRQQDKNVITWETAGESRINHFTVQYSSDGAQFTDAATVTAQNQSAGAVYRYDQVPNTGTAYYRLQVQHQNGEVSWSKIISIRGQAGANAELVRYYSGDRRVVWVNTAMLSQDNTALFRLYNSAGKMVYNSRLGGGQPTLINLHHLPAGLYMAELAGRQEKITGKVMLY